MPVTADDVIRVWSAADSTKAPETRTGGIRQAFLQSGVVESWYREPLTEDLLRDLRLLGGPLEYNWGQLSDGTFLVRTCRLPENADITAEPSPLALVCLQRSDRADRGVLIDGCHRAVCLYHRLQAGHPVPEPWTCRAIATRLRELHREPRHNTLCGAARSKKIEEGRELWRTTCTWTTRTSGSKECG